jgi:hypothetical protein
VEAEQAREGREAPAGTGGERQEDEKQRVDRELIELLNELRVALPGVQVLFAFLLTVPFTPKFAQVTTAQRHVYFATLLCSAAASALLIAPSAYHRLRFRQGDKKQMLITSNRLSIVGLAFLALAMTGVVLLITDLLFKATGVVIVTAVTAALFAWFWYGLALSRRLRDA